MRKGSLEDPAGVGEDWLPRSRSRYISISEDVLLCTGCGAGVTTGWRTSFGGGMTATAGTATAGTPLRNGEAERGGASAVILGGGKGAWMASYASSMVLISMNSVVCGSRSWFTISSLLLLVRMEVRAGILREVWLQA